MDAHRTVEAVWRIESARLIAGLTRMVRGDVGLAEELAQDALVAALEQWPQSGVPRNPGAWLMMIAKRRAIDHFRRRERLDRKQQEIARDMQIAQELPDLDDHVGDDILRLMFIACHPVLSTEARVALTLRLLGGLTTEEIARAYLVAESTVAQRIVRAKKTLAAKRVPFELPALPERLPSVLDVLYLIFNEGYAATAGDDLVRPELCREALRLGRVLSELVPGEVEVHGLVALMDFQASRTAARVGPDGEMILLLAQDRTRWDHVLIRHGLAELRKADELGQKPGPYALQAAIAACHARAHTAEATDWPRIAALYRVLAELTPTPVVELNRAVAVAMAFGPAVGLELVDSLVDEPALADYHLLPSVRGDLLFRLGRLAEARVEFERAAALTRNTRERTFLLDRAANC